MTGPSRTALAVGIGLAGVALAVLTWPRPSTAPERVPAAVSPARPRPPVGRAAPPVAPAGAEPDAPVGPEGGATPPDRGSPGASPPGSPDADDGAPEPDDPATAAAREAALRELDDLADRAAACEAVSDAAASAISTQAQSLRDLDRAVGPAAERSIALAREVGERVSEALDEVGCD